ncbi:MAG: tetratricopeptide repeat protein [Acidobacteriota bacterium]
MTSTTVRESPIPVLIILVALFGFVEYLHRSVANREDRPLLVQVPDQFIAPPPPGHDDVFSGADGALRGDLNGPSAGPLHAASRDLAARGQVADALDKLDASLKTEGVADATRLHERGILLLRLDRPADALAPLQAAAKLASPAATLLFNLGLAQSRSGDEGAAERSYRQALAINPALDSAWNNLGLLLERSGSHTDALAALRQAVDYAPSGARFRAQTNLARLLLDDDRTEEARGLVDDAMRSAPSALAPRLLAASIAARGAGGEAEARRLYARTLRLAPGNPVPLFSAARFENRFGHVEAAERHYREALELDPTFRTARFNLGLLLLNTGRAADAAREFELLGQTGEDARAAFGLARARRALGDPAGAEAAYRQAIEQAGGTYPEVFFNLGALFHDTGRNDEAAAAYRTATRQRQGYTAAWLNLSLLLMDMNRPDAALDAVEHALAASADNPKAWFVRGRLLSEAHRSRAAIAAYEEAVRLRPAYSKALLNAAVLHSRAGEDGEAIGLYRRLLAGDPHNAAAWFNLGLALRREHRDDEATQAYEAALQSDPTSVAAAQNLGVLYVRAGRIEDARRVFREGLEHHPDNVALRFNMALQMEKEDEIDEAITEVRRVLQLRPDHDRAWQVLSRLLEKSGQHTEAERAAAHAADTASPASSRAEERP